MERAVIDEEKGRCYFLKFIDGERRLVYLEIKDYEEASQMVALNDNPIIVEDMKEDEYLYYMSVITNLGITRGTPKLEILHRIRKK